MNLFSITFPTPAKVSAAAAGRPRGITRLPLAALLGLLVAAAAPAPAQTLTLNYAFADAPGTTTADSVTGAMCLMTNYNKAAADMHGAGGSGPGKLGRTLDFTTDDGANSGNTVTSGATTASVSDYADPRIALGTVSTFTVAFWFKSTATLGSGYSPQLFVLAPGGNARSTLAQGNANTLGFTINTSGNPQFWAGTSTYANPVASSTLVANVWYFYALTYDGSNYRVYVGNETNAISLVNTVASAGQALAFGSSGTIVFGDRASDNTRNFPGWLARFQFFTGAASQNFVDGLRQAGLPLTVGPTVFSPLSPVYVGTPVTLSAAVTNGVPPYSYQWQVNQGAGFVNITGATSNNYVLDTTGAGGTTYQYELALTDSESPAVSVTNAAAALFVSTAPLAPTIVSNTTISPASVLLGGSATLNAVISGTAPVACQWQYSATNNGSGLVNVPGATSTTLVLTNLQYASAGYYWLTATNSTGGLTTTFAHLAVQTPVAINAGPAGVDAGLVVGTLGSGTYAVAQLSSAGDAKFPNGLNYYDNGGNGGYPGQTFVTGSNPGGYSLSDLYYLCGGPSVADGSHGAGLSYTLRIYSLTNALTGTATLISTYTNQNTAPALPNNVWAQWTGLTNVLAPNSFYAYSIQGPSYMHMGNASNSPAPYSGGELAMIPAAGGTMVTGAGSPLPQSPQNSSAAFLLDLVPAGYPDAESLAMSPTNGSTVFAGVPITLSVTASGSNIGYVWRLDGNGLPNSNSPAYVLDTAGVAAGTHTVTVLVTNAFDTATSVPVSFSVVPAVIQSVAIAPANAATNPVYAGTVVNLSAAVQGNNLAYYWQTDNGNGNWTTIPNSNTTNLTLNTSGLAPGTYQYVLVAQNGSGSVTSPPVTLNLAAASGPVLVTGATAAPTVVMLGGSVQLSASFAGSQPISYQWYFASHGGAGQPVAAATNATYSLANAQLTNAGTYYLAAANTPPGLGAQSANSAAVILYVVNPAQTNTAAAVVSDGGGSPVTGSYDVMNLSYDSGLLETSTGERVNAYIDANTPVGQIFETGSTPPAGYNGFPLGYVYFKEDPSGGTSGFANSMGYVLNVYQMLDGTNAELLTSYTTTNTTTLASGDWIYISGLTNLLQPNTSYCLSLHKNTTSGYYWKFDGVVEAAPDSLFPSSQTLVAVPAYGGAVTFSSPDPTYGYYYDTAFVAGLTPQGPPYEVSPMTITPSTIYNGQGPVIMASHFDGLKPMTYQWTLAGTNLPGATGPTYVVTNATFAVAGQYVCYASNSLSLGSSYAGPTPSTPQTLTVSDPPDTFVMNFSKPAYSGPGAIGTGSAWNHVTGGGGATENGASGTIEQSTVNGATLDDGYTLMPIQFSTFETWEFTHGGGIGLLDNYMLLQGQPATALFAFTFSNCIPGVYNLVLYGEDGSYGGGHTVFTVGGVSQTNVNSGNDSAFIQGDNYSAFYGIAATNTLTGYWSQSTSEAGFNGAQLELAYPAVNPHMFIGVQPTNVTVPLNYPAGLAVVAVGPGTNWLPGPLFYQWWNAGTANAIPGATNSTFTVATAAAGSQSYYAVITNLTGLSTNSATATVTVYVPDTLRWVGGAGPAWDLSTPNWFDVSTASGGALYADPEYVVFDDTASEFVVSNMVAVNPASVLVTNSLNAYVFAGAASIAGPAALTKTGTGSLTISNNQTYTGGTLVNQGTLILAKGGAAGSLAGTLTVTGPGTVSLQAVDALGYSGNYVTALNLAGSVLDNATTGNEGYGTTFNLTGGTMKSSGGGAYNIAGGQGAINSLPTNVPATITANVSLRANGLVITTAPGSVPGGVDLSISGAVRDGGGNQVTKAGDGTLSLSGTNTFNGDITITGGTLRIDGAGNLNGGNYTAQIHNNGALFSYNSSAAQTLGVVSGTGPLTQNGPGTLTLNSVNTYAGATTVNGGTLAGNGTIAGPVTVNSGATLAPGAAGAGTLTLTGNLLLRAGSTSSFAVNGSTPANAAVALGGSVTYGGTLTVVPSGVFASGQQFTLFSGAGAANAGNFASLAGSPGPGLAFTFTNGVLTVVSTGPTGPVPLTNSINGSVLSLSWASGQGWRLQAQQTNSLAVGLSTNWTYVTDGTVSSTNITINRNQPTVFYRLAYP